MSPSRWIEFMPLAEITGADLNPKKHSPDLGVSIDRFGFADGPIRDERTGKLVAGHGRVEELRLMEREGGKPPSGVELEVDGSWLVPVQRGWSSLDDQEAAAFLVAHNRITEQGGWDDATLVELLKTFDDEGGLEGLGFEEEEVEAMLGGFESMSDLVNDALPEATGADDGGVADQKSLTIVLATSQFATVKALRVALGEIEFAARLTDWALAQGAE